MITNAQLVMQELNQRPIAYYPIYKDVMGTAAGAVFLSQLMYWFGASKKNKIYKVDAEIREETGLSEYELKTAKSKLKSLGFISVTLSGLPAKTYYKIDWDEYQTSLAETSKLDGRKPPNQLGGNLPTGLADVLPTNTESTTEITPKTTPEKKEKTLTPVPGGKIFSLLEKHPYSELTLEEVESITPEDIDAAFLHIRTNCPSAIKREDKIEQLMKIFPVGRLVNTILHTPVDHPSQLAPLWNLWRAGSRAATIPATDVLLVAALCTINKDCVSPRHSLREFIDEYDPDYMDIITRSYQREKD
jgi:hypothetical protein